VVNAVSGETGNNSRDQRMHKEILETWKFAEATFRPMLIDGQVSLTAPSDFKVKASSRSTARITNLLRTFTRFAGDHWKGTAS